MHFNRKKIRAKLKIANKGLDSRNNKRHEEDIVPIFNKRAYNKNIKIIKNSFDVSLSDSKENSIYKPIEEWKGVLKGQTAFILGNAPSIGKEKLSVLDECFTIGINRIFYIYDPVILFWQDKQLWDRDKAYILEQKAIKVCSRNADPRRYFLNFDVARGPFLFGNDLRTLHGVGNTMALAAQMAVVMGCSNIVLLGNDCKYGENGITDFYGKNIDHRPYTLNMCTKAMRWLRDKCPIPIYSCGDSILWEKKTLEEVVEKINPVKMTRDQYREIFLR